MLLSTRPLWLCGCVVVNEISTTRLVASCNMRGGSHTTWIFDTAFRDHGASSNRPESKLVVHKDGWEAIIPYIAPQHAHTDSQQTEE